MSTAEMASVIEDRAVELLERHGERSREWFPHQLVPWELGGPETRQPVEAPGATLPPGAASALWVNLLTEDNLPHYFHAIATVFDHDTAMGAWSRRWAAEEQRHAIALRDWVCLTNALDPVALERARMAQVGVGFRPLGRGISMCDGLVYLTLQELATRVSHSNTAALLDDVGTTLVRRIAADENHHHLFYRDLVTTALQADPSAVVCAIDRQVSDFSMPGTEIEGFAAHASAIAAAGIYDFRVHYRNVVAPVVLGQWGLEDVVGLDAEAEAARDHVMARIARLRRVAERMEAQAERVPAG